MNPALITSSLTIKLLMDQNPLAATSLWMICNDIAYGSMLSAENRKSLEDWGLIDHKGYPVEQVVKLMRTYSEKDILNLWKKK